MSGSHRHATRAVTQEYKRQRREKETGLELYFAREPLPEHEPVYVFQHTMKTGGTSLRALIYYNVSQVAEYDPRDMRKSSRWDFPGLYAEVYEGLTLDQRTRLTWAISHSASYLIPHIERPVRGVTIVREPMDRAISRYWFAAKSLEARTLESLQQLFVDGPLPDGKLVHHYANPQSRWLLGPHFDLEELPATAGSPPDADLWQKRLTDVLDQNYAFVLVQDRLDDAMIDLAQRFGWTAATPIFRRSGGARPAVTDVGTDLRDLISAYNWLDVDLYRYAVARADRDAAGKVA